MSYQPVLRMRRSMLTCQAYYAAVVTLGSLVFMLRALRAQCEDRLGTESDDPKKRQAMLRVAQITEPYVRSALSIENPNVDVMAYASPSEHLDQSYLTIITPHELVFRSRANTPTVYRHLVYATFLEMLTSFAEPVGKMQSLLRRHLQTDEPAPKSRSPLYLSLWRLIKDSGFVDTFHFAPEIFRSTDGSEYILYLATFSIQAFYCGVLNHRDMGQEEIDTGLFLPIRQQLADLVDFQMYEDVESFEQQIVRERNFVRECAVAESEIAAYFALVPPVVDLLREQAFYRRRAPTTLHVIVSECLDIALDVDYGPERPECRCITVLSACPQTNLATRPLITYMQYDRRHGRHERVPINGNGRIMISA